jgi:hypothetical protein
VFAAHAARESVAKIRSFAEVWHQAQKLWEIWAADIPTVQHGLGTHDSVFGQTGGGVAHLIAEANETTFTHVDNVQTGPINV